MFEKPGTNAENIGKENFKNTLRALALIGTVTGATVGTSERAQADQSTVSHEDSEVVKVEHSYVTALKSRLETQDETRDAALNEMESIFGSITESIKSSEISEEDVESFLLQAQSIVDSYQDEVSRVQDSVALVGISEITAENLSQLAPLDSELLQVAAEGLKSAQTDLREAIAQVDNLTLVASLMVAPDSEIHNKILGFWKSNPSVGK